jgi:hypothetical protein
VRLAWTAGGPVKPRPPGSRTSEAVGIARLAGAVREPAARDYFLGFQSDFWISAPAVLNVNARCLDV